MIQKLNLRELKGAPLSIILAIMMAGNRTVTVSYLCTETGYSDKTVSNGLDLLRGRQIVTETRRNHYQLTGGNVQLPLYWDERTEPADPSPASFQEELPGIRSQDGKFSDGNFQSGKIPETGIAPRGNLSDLIGEIPEMKARISALEAEVEALKTGISPRSGESSADTGEIPNVKFKQSTINENINTQEELIVVPEKIPESEKIPENLTDDERDSRFEINREAAMEYWRQSEGYQLDYCAPRYKKEEYEEFLNLDGDPEIFEFILPRAASPDAVKSWLKLSRKQAKDKLARLFGFWGDGLKELTTRDDIHLQHTDYAYWNWKKNEQNQPNIKIGIVLMRILNHYDELSAKNSYPLEYKYLEAV